MKCKNKKVTSRASVRQQLVLQGVIDKYNKILDYPKFISLANKWSKDAYERFGVGKLMFEENGKVLFNEEAFQIIDAKKGIKYPENEKFFQLDDSLVPDSNSLEGIKDRLLTFVKNVNPDFQVNYVKNLSVNGLTKVSQFLIEYKDEKAIPEEVAHVFVELLKKDTALYKEMYKEITKTKMYKKVLEDYGNHPDYEGNYDKLKREAIAKLVSLYTYDKKLAEYYTGSAESVNSWKSLVNTLLALVRKVLKINPYELSSQLILSGDTNLLMDSAYNTETMYQLIDLDEMTSFQTLSRDLTKYDRVLINLNDTILNYAQYSIPDRGKLQGKTIKSKMFFDPNFMSDLEDFYKKANLTKLGRELKDKIGFIDPTKTKVVFYTSAPLTPGLQDRIQNEFGNVQIIRISGEQIKGEDELGNPILEVGNNYDLLRKLVTPDSLLINNQRDEMFKENLDVFLYNNNIAKYTDYREQIKRKELEQKNKEFETSILEEFKKLDPSNVISLAKPALNLIRKLTSMVENERFEEVTEMFKDEYGNLIIPSDRARMIIRQLEENPKEFEQGVLSFINTIGSTSLFWTNANKSNFKILRQLAESSSKEDISKAIKDSASLMRMILQWEEWINSVQPLLSNPEFEDITILKDIVGKLSSTLKISKDRINDISVKVLSKQLAGFGDSYNAGKLEALNKGFITQKQYEESIVTPQRIANIIFGLEGDVSMVAYLESGTYINNDLIQTVTMMVEKSIIGSDRNSIEQAAEVGQKLWEIESKTGMKATEIGEKITYLDKENYYEDGEMKQREVLIILNPHKDRWKYEFEKYKLDKAKDKFLEAKSLDKDSQDTKDFEKEYDDAYEAFKRWEKENWYRTYETETKDIYEKFGLTTGENGKHLERATEIQEALWEEKRAKMADLRILNDPTQEALLIKDLELIDKRIKNLRNTYDVYNDREKIESENPEEDIRVAKILKEKNKIDRQLFDYKINEQRFKRDLTDKILEIADNTVRQMFLGLITNEEKWLSNFIEVANDSAPQSLIDFLDQHTKVIYTEDFYESRKEILENIGVIIEELSKFTKNPEDLLEIKDNLKSKWEEIFNLSTAFRDEDGVFDASDASVNHQKLIKDVESEIEFLKKLLKDSRDFDKSKYLEIKDLKETLAEQFKLLGLLQGKGTTAYYDEVFYEKLKDIYPKELGGAFAGDNFLALANSKEFTKWLQVAPQDFKDWFYANHFVSSSQSEDVNEFGEFEEITNYKPTYIWMRISPKNEKHIKSVPSYKYSEREFKDEVYIDYDGKQEYFRIKTEKNKDTWDPILKEWLPKSSEFKNEKYFETIKDKNLKDYLDIVTEAHLSKQEDAPRESRLGLKVPFMEKQFTDGGGLQSMWKKVTSRLNPTEAGEENAQGTPSSFKDRLRAFVGLETPETQTKVIQTDLLGNKIEHVYTPYTIWIDPKNVTRDIGTAILTYGEALGRTKSLINNIPELNLLEQLLSQFNPFEKGVTNTKGQNVNAGTNRMLDIIKNIKKTKIYGNVKEYELGRGVDRATLHLRNYTSFFSQSVFNPANSIKNYLQGQFTNFISSGEWTDNKSLRKAMLDPKTSFIKYASELGNKSKSLDFQLISMFNLSLTSEISQMFTSTGKTRQVVNKGLFLSSEAVEFGVVNTLLYAHLYSKKIQINGEEKSLYDVFTLNNGKIEIKPNSFDNSKPIDQDYINDLILKLKVVTEQVQGKQWTNKYVDRYTLWRNMEFFKKYFIPKLRERFVSKRKNLSMGNDIEGFYRTSLRIFVREILALGETHKLSGVELSPQERNALRLMGREFLMMLATYLLISLVFGYDDDDEERYSKLKENSWVTNFSLQVLLNAKKETDSASIIPLINIQENFTPPLLNETYNYVKQPFIGFGLFEQSKKLADALSNHLIGDPYYGSSMPQYGIEKGDSKLSHRVESLTHFNDLFYLANPNFKIQVQQQMGNLN